MKKITILGMGMGVGNLTQAALMAIRQADVLLGSPRMQELIELLPEARGKLFYPQYQPKAVQQLISSEEACNFAILMSGDIGFYSGAAKLRSALEDYEMEFVPGISTVNAFFAKLGLAWENAYFVSLHGRNNSLTDVIRRNRLTFCLTGNNIAQIGKDLNQNGFGKIKIYVGENLEAKTERVYETLVEDLPAYEFPSLTVLLFVNENYDERTPTGLPDDRFHRLPSIPMTKSETRSIVLASLQLKPQAICWDIGAGTGSATIEMALNAYKGHVYAIERKEDALPLIRENCQTFHLGNVTLVQGMAPAALADLPKPDAVFIGGSGGEISEIIKTVWQRNPNARIVTTAVTIETVSLSLQTYKALGIEPEIKQISVARAKKVGNLHLMEAQNPITVIVAGSSI